MAWGWNVGAIVSPEDLNLHDESMDIRMPDEALRAAHGLVRARRKAATVGREVLSPEGASWLAGRRRRAPSPARAESLSAPGPRKPETPLLAQLVDQLERLRAGRGEGAEDAVAEWLDLLSASEGVPLLLQAAAALEGWRIVEPFPREPFVGPLLVAHWLQGRKRVRSHLLGLEAGLRVVSRARPSSALPPAERILFWLAVISEAAAQAGEELNRLELARKIAVGHMRDRRAHSHLGGVIELFLERPVVTAPMAAQRLKVSPQTARRLIGQLGGSVTEISGQARFRAWRL